MNTSDELEKVIAYLRRDHDDPAAACRLAAVQLRIVVKRRRWRRNKDRIVCAAIAAVERRKGA